MDTNKMSKEAVAKAIKANGIKTCMAIMPERTRYYLTHELSYGKVR